MARVLCIEDEAEMSQLVEMILTRQGYEVYVADRGAAGLEMVESIQPDIILLDLMMPDMDGWEVYQQLKEQAHTVHIPVVVVTARAQSSEKTVALKVAQVDDYVVKPFNPGQLLETVERVLKR